MPASRTAILALCPRRRTRFAPRTRRRAARALGALRPRALAAACPRPRRRRVQEEGGGRRRDRKGQTLLEKQWASFTQLVEEATTARTTCSCAPRPPATRPSTAGARSARAARGAPAPTRPSPRSSRSSRGPRPRSTASRRRARRLEFAHTPADPAAFNVERFEVELKHAPPEELDQPRGALAVAARVADAGAIAPADVGFKPVRSPLAKEGELTHAVAGNSKNLAGMAKNAKVAASGKQGGMKGGYL